MRGEKGVIFFFVIAFSKGVNLTKKKTKSKFNIFQNERLHIFGTQYLHSHFKLPLGCYSTIVASISQQHYCVTHVMKSHLYSTFLLGFFCMYVPPFVLQGFVNEGIVKCLLEVVSISMYGEATRENIVLELSIITRN